MKRTSVILLILMGLGISAKTQPSDSVNRKRLKPLIIGSSVAYAGALVGLNELWYSDFEKESFHFFDDHKEWKQMDKLGHFYSAFHISQGSFSALQWTGLQNKKSLFWGVVVSAAVITPIEIFDGFSAEYGASFSDLIANTAGASLFYLQQSQWNEVRIHPKFSFHTTKYPPYRPDLLGNTFNEELLKDYNGQTYWLSFDISKMTKASFPKWLNLALGYSANNMVAANSKQSREIGFNPYRQYFIAIDFDFNEYKSRSKFINTLLYLVNMVHLPAPTLEYGQKLKFHLAYY